MNKNFAILVSSCDLYEDAWNPFFRLLQVYWPECPRNVYLITETKEYVDSYFNITCIKSSANLKWGARLIEALQNISEEYIMFFLEDFFLLDRVNNDLFIEAFECIKSNSSVGVIKFIPHVPANSYYLDESISEFFSPTYREYRARNAGLASLWRKEYYLKLLRKFENPWEFELFGAKRSKRYPELILFQNDALPVVFPYEVLIKYGYGISKKKWLRNNKSLFEKHGIEVDFENLGWYDYQQSEKIVGLKRTKKEKLLMPFKEPKLFIRICKIEVKQKIYLITHIRNYF